MYKALLEFHLLHEYFNRYVGNEVSVSLTSASKAFCRSYGLIFKKTAYGFMLLGKQDDVKRLLEGETDKINLSFVIREVSPTWDLISKLKLRGTGQCHYFDVASEGVNHRMLEVSGEDKGQPNLSGMDMRTWALVNICLDPKELSLESLPAVRKLNIEGRAIEWRYRIVDSRNKFDEIKISVPEWSDVTFEEPGQVVLSNGQPAKEFRSQGRRAVRVHDDLIVTLEMFWENERVKRKVTMELPRPDSQQLKYERGVDGDVVHSTIYVYV